MNTNIFDIETAPNEELAIKLLKPFPPFDPTEIKYGNTKDPEKRKAIEISKASDHAIALAKHEATAIDKAALNPATSTIVAIGIHLEDAPEATILLGEEKDILTQFWELIEAHKYDKWAFYSGSNDRSAFDPRHVINRSWANRLSIPEMVDHKGYINGMFVDLAPIYLAGASYPSYCSADQCSKELGCEGDDVGFGGFVLSKDELDKDHKITGKNFHKFLASDDYDREIAIKYLTNDLKIERAIANRIL